MKTLHFMRFILFQNHKLTACKTKILRLDLIPSLLVKVLDKGEKQ